MLNFYMDINTKHYFLVPLLVIKTHIWHYGPLKTLNDVYYHI